MSIGLYRFHKYNSTTSLCQLHPKDLEFWTQALLKPTSAKVLMLNGKLFYIRTMIALKLQVHQSHAIVNPLQISPHSVSVLEANGLK